MKRYPQRKTEASTLVVTVSVVATILVLLGSAVGYTQHVSRVADRTRKAALATEIADGHLEFLFSNWRNIQRMNSPTTGFGTNYFPTAMFTPSPAPGGNAAPSPIPLLDPALFPETGYSVTQYRIQAVTPMVQLEADCSNRCSVLGGSYPISFTGDPERSILPDNVSTGSVKLPPAVGPFDTSQGSGGGNTAQLSYFYLAAVDVSVPTPTGPVTTKVRRVFEKKIDNPWGFAMFYVDDLELNPASPMTVYGPIMTNNNLYIASSNFAARNQYDSLGNLVTPGKVAFAGDYINGYSPNDTSTKSTAVSSPSFVEDMPPMQEGALLPFSWNVQTNDTPGSPTNSHSYREIIERPTPGAADEFSTYRYYNQADVKVLVNAKFNTTTGQVVPGSSATGSSSLTVATTVATAGGPSPTPAPVPVVILNASNTLVTSAAANGTTDKAIYNMFFQSGALSLNAFFDSREGTYVRVTNVDISKLKSYIDATGDSARRMPTTFGGVIYISDITTTDTLAKSVMNGTTSVDTYQRGIRLMNGFAMPAPPAGYYKLADGTVPYKGGLTVASENPVYIWGNYNTANNVNDLVPSNGVTPDFTKPKAASYTKQPAAVLADAITMLSGGPGVIGGWADVNSTQSAPSGRPAISTTINAALLAGNVPSASGSYSGGGENFIRLLEDWGTNSRTFCYYGSMVQLFKSQQAKASYASSSSIFKSPKVTGWYWDSLFGATNPPGNLRLASFLQQQRWYQVY